MMETINGIMAQIPVQQFLPSLDWILTGIGLFMIFRKCGHKGWTAFIPGARLYVLSEAADRESDGVVAFFTEVATLILARIVIPICGILSIFFLINKIIDTCRKEEKVA